MSRCLSGQCMQTEAFLLNDSVCYDWLITTVLLTLLLTFSNTFSVHFVEFFLSYYSLLFRGSSLFFIFIKLDWINCR